jgi:epoxyqueuosine reductase QueG
VNEAEHNFEQLKTFFQQKLTDMRRDGVIGVANFQNVYDSLMPQQQVRLNEICREQFHDCLEHGSIICLGMAYPESTIDVIDARLADGTADKASWNLYAREYNALNKALDAAAKEIAQRFSGIVIPPVTGTTAEKVEDYYGRTISHRVVAEHAGLGWRGKNELLVNERFSCAVRFASVVTLLPLLHGKKLNVSCGDCTACLEACGILKIKGELPNYRENCMQYLMKLGLEKDVCGKCIKTCYRQSKYASQFKLK